MTWQEDVETVRSKFPRLAGMSEDREMAEAIGRDGGEALDLLAARLARYENALREIADGLDPDARTAYNALADEEPEA